MAYSGILRIPKYQPLGMPAFHKNKYTVVYSNIYNSKQTYCIKIIYNIIS